jgi:invasion protein IalB
MIRLVLTATIALALFSAAAAQTPQPATPAQEEMSLHRYGDIDKTCQEWTDSCRTCTRPENGEAVCSNIGISCQPKAISCSRRIEEKKPEEKK